MKKILNSVFYMLLVMIVILFASCEKDGVTSIIINKSTLSQNVGRIDTIVVTVKYTGDLTKTPATWAIADTNIVSMVTELKGAVSVSNSESSIEKMLVIKAKKSGTTKVTLTAGDKSIDCDVTVIMRKFTFTKILASNYGDYYDIGTNNFDMVLYENSMSLNADDRLVGNGNFLQVEFNVSDKQSSFAPGNFLISEDGDVSTFFPGQSIEYNGNTYFVGTFLVNSKSNVRTYSLIEGGSYKITNAENGFKITGELLLEDGEVVQFEYSGSVNIADKRDAAEIKPMLTHGLLDYYGDLYETKNSNLFLLEIASQSLIFNDSTTKGDNLSLFINVSPNIKDLLPNGTYTMINFSAENKELPISDFIPFTLIPGYYTNEYFEYGSWFYRSFADPKKDITKKLKYGSITVTKTGVKSYEISYNFTDRFGATVSGTFNGDLEYTDKTKPASGVGLKKVVMNTKSRLRSTNFILRTKQSVINNFKQNGYL